jgi:hypothetical protein
MLTNVVSQFNYQQQIRTAGSQMTIQIETTADTADQPVEQILDQSGNPITTEDNQPITTERVPDVVGDGNEENLIRNDNDIEVVEYSTYHPNGITVFQGYIAKWKVTFGADDNIEITVISHGQDMSQYLVESGDTAYISQTAQTGTGYSIKYVDKGSWFDFAAQTFTMPLTKTVDAITVMVTTTMACSVVVSVKQMLGTSPNPSSDTLVAQGSYSVSGAVTQQEIKVAFNAATDLATGLTYYIVIASSDTGSAYAIASNANPYANGSVYTYSYYGTSYSAVTNYSGSDLYFIIWQYGGSTNATYTNADATAILTDIISEYQSRGGEISTPTNPITPIVTQNKSGTTLPTAYWSMAYCQSFTPTSNLNINIVQLAVSVTSNSQNLYVEIWRGNPDLDSLVVMGGLGTYTNGGGSTLVATSQTVSITNTTKKVKSFKFNSTVSLTSGQQYFLRFFFQQGQIGYLKFYGMGNGDLPITAAMVGNLYFGLVTVNNSGSNIDYDSAYPAMYFNLGYANPMPAVAEPGYTDSGNLVTYTFKQQTILEAVNVISSLLPYNWYWYVNPADDVLYCQPVATTADHIIIKNRHIDELSLEATKEHLTNVVYFTGGPVASVNIFTKTTDATSLADNRVGLAKLSDNRVITDTNATLISQNYIDLHNAEEYTSQITVSDSVYDISTFQLGETVQFAGFGTFMDKLLLQIVGINRGVESVTLDVGVLPKRASKQVDDLERDLAKQETLNNPAVPT